MADNSVFITGIAEGTLKEAIEELPGWATEDTAFKIQKLLTRSLDTQNKTLAQILKTASAGGTGLTPDDVKKLNNETDKWLKNLVAANAEDKKRKKNFKDKDKDDKDNLFSSKKLRTTTDKLNYVLTGLATIGSKVMKVENQYIDTYDALYKSGINVLNGNNSTADGFEALNQMVNLTGIRLENLQKVAEKYSDTINAAGMLKFTKAVSASSKALVSLGYSSTEQLELIGSIMEAEQGYTDVRKKSSEQIADDAQRIGSQFNKLSQTVGLNRQQLLDNMKTNARSNDSTLVAARWGEQAAENVAKAAAGLKDQNLAKIFTQFAAASDPVYTQAFKDLNAAGLGDIATQFAQLGKDMKYIDPTEFQKRLDALTKNIDPKRIAALTDQQAGGNQAADAAVSFINMVQQQSRRVSEATDGQQTAATKTEAAIAGLQTEVEKLSAAGQAAFFPMIAQVNAVTDAMKLLNDAIYKVIGSINAETRSWIGVGLVLAGFTAGLLVAVRSVRTFFSLFGKGPGIISKAFTGMGKLIMSAGTGVASMLRGAGTLLIRGISGIGNMLKLAGSAIPTVLRGAGNLISKAFSGVGNLLKTAGSAAWNAVRGVGSGIAKGMASAGTWIIDALKGVGSWASSAFSRLVGTISSALRSAGTWILDASTKVMTFAKDALMRSVSWIANTTKSIFSAVGNSLKAAGTWISDAIRGLITNIGKAGSWVGNAIKGAGTWISNLAKSVFSGGAKLLSSAGEWIGGALKGAGQWIASAVKSVFGGASKFISEGVGWIGNALKSGGNAIVGFFKGAGAWIMNAFKGVFGEAAGFLGSIFSKIGGVVGEVLPFISKIGGLALRFAGVLGWLYTAFEVGWAIGTKLYEIVSKFDWVTSAFDKLFIGLDKLISYLPGQVGRDAQQRLDVREKAEKALVNAPAVKKPEQISVPKAPMASTINSPSAVSADPTKTPADTAPPAGTEPSKATGSGIEKPAETSDINNLLSYQSTILEQILLSTNSLVSVNKDILRSARNQ